MEPARQRTVGILLFDDVEVLDFAGPYEVFSRTRLQPGVESRRTDESAPFRVVTVAQRNGEIRATGGLRVLPDHGFDSVPHLDVLVVPGGFGTRGLLENATLLSWIADQARRVEQLASVCTGALLLARAGLLSGKRATTHWGAYDLLAQLDNTIEVNRDARVVTDGIVTSAGVAAGMDMAFTLIERFCGRDVAAETARYIEYPRHG
jgi:transcriptional regulator GlxA family with amidase domain